MGDFPNPDMGAMRGQIPPTNFYGQEFYDMQPQQPQSMQGYYETSNSLMVPGGMQPSYPASPSPASSWSQQYPVLPVPPKIEPPSTPVPGVNEAYFNPTPDPMGPPTNEHFPGPFAIEQPSTTAPEIVPPPQRGAASRKSVGKGGVNKGGVNKRRGKAAAGAANPDDMDPHLRAAKE